MAIFALGIILNVSQSFSTEKELNSFQEFNFNNDTYFVYNTIEESLPEKNVLKLPIMIRMYELFSKNNVKIVTISAMFIKITFSLSHF